MARSSVTVGLACSFAVASAFCPAVPLSHESAPMHRACPSRSICASFSPAMSLRSQCDQDRRKFVLSFGALAASQVLPLSPLAAKAEDEVSSDEQVCNNPLGCEIPKKLAPPKRVFKDILEEERQLARQRDELAEQARAQQRQGVMKQVAAHFAELKKGRDDMARDIGQALSKLKEDATDTQEAWDDIRRMSRLYDTALRKDVMYRAADGMKKAKIDFDRKTSDALCSSLNTSLKSLDGAAKKKDVQTASAKFEDALGSLDSWLALQPL